MTENPTKAEREEAHRNARDAWARTRKVGDPIATFLPGQELRCPATRHVAGGVRRVCAASLDEWVKPGSKVIVRVRSPFLQAMPHAGTDCKCHSCGWGLEIFAVLEATG